MRYIISFIVCCFAVFAHAEVSLELTQGKDARTPVGVVPFAGEANLSVSLSQVINADLDHSGRFITSLTGKSAPHPHVPSEVSQSYWQGAGMEDVVIGKVTALPNGQYRVQYYLMDIFSQHVQEALSSKSYTVSRTQLRQVAHAIANDVYYQLTGYGGFFTAPIAYVLVQHAKPTRYKLMVSDYDGYHAQMLVDSPYPLLSPRWSPDGKHVAYVTVNPAGSVIYLVNVFTGQRSLIANYKGINSAPAWSPDGKRLAMVLSAKGSPNLYLYTIATKQFVQLTNDRWIDNEPTFTPDGERILFTSNREGSPQIYAIDLRSLRTTKITSEGKYNASANVSPSGEWMAMLHQNANELFSVAVQSLQHDVINVLTTPGLVQSPSFSPDGQMIVYAVQASGVSGRLGMVSLNGKAQWYLPQSAGDMQEPNWSHVRH